MLRVAAISYLSLSAVLGCAGDPSPGAADPSSGATLGLPDAGHSPALPEPPHDQAVEVPPGAVASCASLQLLTAGEPARGDQSRPLEAGEGYLDVGWATPPPERLREERRIHVCGTVVSVRDGEQPGTHDIELGGIDGMTAEDPPAVLSVRLPERMLLPFDPGDTLLVDHTMALVGASAFDFVLISDRDGRLLLSSGGSDGSRIDVGPIVERRRGEGIGWASQRTHRVDVTIDGRTAHVPPYRWRRLETPSGDFAISGGATTWSRGRMPHDAGNSTWHSIVRLVPRDEAP